MPLIIAIVVALLLESPALADPLYEEPPELPPGAAPGNLSICGLSFRAWFSNPMSTSSAPITTNIFNQLGAAPNTIGGNFNGMSFLAVNGYYDASLYQRFPSEATTTWNQSQGWWGAPFRDFAYFNFLPNINLLVYIQESDPHRVWWVFLNLQTHDWYGNKLAYVSWYKELQHVQAVTDGGSIFMSVQQIEDNVVLYGSGEASIQQPIDMWPVTFTADGNLFKPQGEHKMFWGNLDGFSYPILWFYYIDTFTGWPRLAYSSYGNGELSDPVDVGSYSGGYPLYNTTSLSVVVDPPMKHAMLMRTGFYLQSSTLPTTLYFIIKLSASPSSMNACQYERVLMCCRPSINQKPISTWKAPAAVTNAEYDVVESSVSFVYVDIDSGEVFGVTGEPWPYPPATSNSSVSTP